MSMKVVPTEGVGATTEGIQLSKVGEAEASEIKTALGEHGVIFFRDQDLSEDQHIAVAKRFGKININRFFAAHPKHPEIALVAKEADQTDNIGGGWHTDHSYDHEPALGSILVSRVLPETGGDTYFASMYGAYDALDDDTKAEIEGLRAVHSSKHIFGQSDDALYKNSDTGPEALGSGRIGNAEVAEKLRDPSHPVVITHPISGKKALYVNPAFTVNIEGQTKEESLPLLHKLFAHCFAGEQFHYRFTWEPGSVAFWDNRSTWHWALNDYQGQRRVMHRITIEGCALN
ncbi:MAG: TauD/TfdA family dioxygenase [Pseudomonadota bacterium]